VLKIGIDIAAVNTGSQTIGEVLQEKYPEVFSGVGKLKDRAVQLHIDPNVKPVAQPIRRTPFSLRSKVEEKLQELINLDIIERQLGQPHELIRWLSFPSQEETPVSA